MGATYKNNIELTIFGESHGKAIGITIGNLPSGIQIDLDEVARDMKRRAPGQNKMSTARKEADQVEILSGLQDGITTGAPLTGVIYNSDQHSKDYSLLKTNMRPGHSDYPAYIKYKGFNDVRGGGHFSGRITAPIVFAGNIAKQILKQKGIVVGAHILSIGNVKDERFPYNVDETLLSSLSQKHYPTIKEDVFEKMEETILKAKENLYASWWSAARKACSPLKRRSLTAVCVWCTGNRRSDWKLQKHRCCRICTKSSYASRSPKPGAWQLP